MQMTNEQMENIQKPQIEEEEKESKPSFDYSKIDYNKYIDSIYNQKKGPHKHQRGGHDNRHDYDKNLVNENVFSYYESLGKADEDPTTFKKPSESQDKMEKRKNRFENQ